MILSGADIIVKTLIEQQTETVFGYPGAQIIDVYDSLYKYQDEINHVLTAHEQDRVCQILQYGTPHGLYLPALQQSLRYSCAL